MILGTGIDSVEIKRFERWQSYAPTQLRRILSPEEIDYCLAQPNKSAERFAARFAAREAFYKALCVAAPGIKLPFLTLCSKVRVARLQKAPQLEVDWEYLRALCPAPLTRCKAHLTLTHTATTATAMVILEAIAPSTRTLI